MSVVILFSYNRFTLDAEDIRYFQFILSKSTIQVGSLAFLLEIRERHPARSSRGDDFYSFLPVNG